MWPLVILKNAEKAHNSCKTNLKTAQGTSFMINYTEKILIINFYDSASQLITLLCCLNSKSDLGYVDYYSIWKPQISSRPETIQ